MTIIGEIVRLTNDVDAYDCQDKTSTTLSAGCTIQVECEEPNDPAAYQRGDGYLVWLVSNKCDDPEEDMQYERWYIVPAVNLLDAIDAYN
jgi:hypothetical protein